MHEEDTHIADAHKFCITDIVKIFLLGYLHADNSSKTGYEKQTQSNDYVVFAAGENGNKYQCQQNTGECGDTVNDAHEHFINPTAEPAGKATDYQTNYKTDCHRGSCNKESCAGTLDEAGENVAAKVVGTEKMLKTGLCPFCGAVHCVGVIRGPECTDNYYQKHQAGDDQAGSERFIFFIYHGIYLNPGARAGQCTA